MASEKSFHSRMFFLCPVCKKAPHSLPGHLRKVCMRNSTKAEIQAVVIEAKKELSEFCHRGRFWEFGKIRDILDSTNPLARMIAEMQSRGLVINNLPSLLPEPARSTTSSVSQSSGEGAEGPVEPPNEPLSDDSSGEYYQSTGGPKWTSSVRVEMVKKGLYNKHSIDHPLLAGFNKDLHIDLGHKNSKQVVETVSRFLHYMDPTEPNLMFVRQVEKVREYFNILSDTKLSKWTMFNYWKSLKRFMKYIITSTDIRHNNPSLFQDCESFLDVLYEIESAMSKKVSMEVTGKKSELGYGKEILPKDCLAVLEAAFKDFQAVICKMQDPGAITGDCLTKNERLLVLYYLEAIIMLKLLQRPSVVTQMTVEDWEGRSRIENGVCVAVKEHKVLLSHEQELWFDLYFNEVRPVMLQENRTGDDVAVDSFFVSSSGRSIYNPSNDLKRLHDKYSLPSVTFGDAQRVFEAAAQNLKSEVERNVLARLFGHVPETAERNYKLRTSSDAFLALSVLDQLAGKTRQRSSRASSRETRVDEETAYKTLEQFCPVTLEGPPPKRARRNELCGSEHERHCYDRWCSEQLKLREQHALEHFAGQQPSESKINRWMDKQGWTSNVPQASVVLKQWKPVARLDSVIDSSFVHKMILSQRWKGLTVRPVPDKGDGVFTKKPFQIGEVVCEYHGQLVSHEDGMAIVSTSGIRPGHLFFYKNKQHEAMCIDAHEESCQCHPMKFNYGRLIRHSSKRANIRPRLYVLNDRDIILFIATKDILSDEELLYNYGSKRRSFAGKGLELDWM
ncbi:uncharacterized protein LOC130223480 [Danio aesculapii]|uniref:uncharacterized protein LOC130223480 n=1 Tax=Danio aesculapii TaxID=1142201 RepID=UPI0024BF4C54|nr:uncharacterized protein LOC130223480 [Danio aesculapii]